MQVVPRVAEVADEVPGLLAKVVVVVAQDGLGPLLHLGQGGQPEQVLHPGDALLVKVKLGQQHGRPGIKNQD